jgi:hypothetical protein
MLSWANLCCVYCMQRMHKYDKLCSLDLNTRHDQFCNQIVPNSVFEHPAALVNVYGTHILAAIIHITKLQSMKYILLERTERCYMQYIILHHSELFKQEPVWFFKIINLSDIQSLWAIQY